MSSGQVLTPTIVSASRATDVPKFYSEWLLARLRKGFCPWTNPFNRQVYKVSIDALLDRIAAIGRALKGCTEKLVFSFADIAVLAKDRDSLKRAIVVAATRRRWTPSEIAPNVIRCTLVQRQHRVEVDLTLTKDNAYSITCRFCNIPEKKYHQWINNLQREIARQLTMP